MQTDTIKALAGLGILIRTDPHPETTQAVLECLDMLERTTEIAAPPSYERAEVTVMAKRTKMQQLAHEDLGAAVIADTEEEADFFIRGMREAAQTADRAAARASRIALQVRRAG